MSYDRNDSWNNLKHGAKRHKLPLRQPAVQAKANPVQRDETERVQAVKAVFGYFLQL